MDKYTIDQAIREMTTMAHFYRSRGMQDKAAQLVDLIQRMENNEMHNVLSMSDYQRDKPQEVEA